MRTTTKLLKVYNDYPNLESLIDELTLENDDVRLKIGTLGLALLSVMPTELLTITLRGLGNGIPDTVFGRVFLCEGDVSESDPTG